MSSFNEMIRIFKRDSYVPKRVWERYTNTLRNLPERGKDSAERTKANSIIYAVFLVVAVIVVGVCIANVM